MIVVKNFLTLGNRFMTCDTQILKSVHFFHAKCQYLMT